MRRQRGFPPVPGRSAACVLLAGVVIGLWGCAATAPTSGGAGSSRPQVWRPAQPDTLGPVLAVVGSHRITRHDIDSVLTTAPQSARDQFQEPDQYKLLVQRIAEQEALYQAAKRAGTESDSAYQVEMAAQARQLLIRHYYQNAVRALPDVPDSAVRQYYEGHASEFKTPGRARVRHILLPTQRKAQMVLKRLKAGATWDQQCVQNSTDKVSAKNGGVIGYVVSDSDIVPGVGKAPKIVAAAFRLKEGETSEPLKSERGWHIIRVDQVAPAGEHPLDEIRKQIRSNLENDRNETFQTTLIDSLKKYFGATVFDDSIDVALRPSKAPADLFQAAQAAASSQERIELFKRVITRYPKDKAAAQAQFMIGFTYAEELADHTAAREAFQEFLKKYPESDLAVSAKWMLENMESSKLPPGVGVPADSSDASPAAGDAPKGTNTKP